MASFSRLQLAAALLEYDNDPDNPDAPKKSAYDSAIFSYLRRANGSIHAKSEAARRSTDFLGVSLPSEAGATEERMQSRKSRATVTELYNPFGEDDLEEEQAEEEPLEVDLASWGLDSLIPKEKGSRASKGKGKAKSDVFPTAKQNQPFQTGYGATMSEGGGRMPHSRSMSAPLNELGAGVDGSEDHRRRNSISNPLDAAEFGELERPGHRRRFSNHPLIESLPIRPPLMSSSSFGANKDTIPFPSSSPIPEDSREGSRAGSRLDDHPEGHGRAYSTASMGTMLSNNAGAEQPNPFAIPPPPASRASRFDPKYAAAARTSSNATRMSVGLQQAFHDENENIQVPRAPSRASALDVKDPRDRRISAASFGTRNMLDDDFQSAYGDDFSPRDRRYSRLDLMRPKVLIMPSPLQNSATSVPEVQKPLTRDGFLDSSDGRPLPPGARTSATRMSMLGPSSSVNVPVPSNSFTPNPRLSLSASQLLFRNTLMVDGQRDVTYNDIDGNLRRAGRDGEQVKVEEIPEEPVDKPKASPITEQPTAEPKTRRPPGKLFGRSLIDDLEARKAEMRSKQRVFTGDQRPSMMDRTMTRSSTLIDPASLVRQPSGKGLESSNSEPALNRRNSRGGQPLLTFDDNGILAETGNRESAMPKARSVFGVDKLWEREVAKLKEIEAQEKLDAEERRKQEEEEAKKAKKKKKGKGKGKEPADLVPFGDSSFTAASNVSASVPRDPSPSLALPDIAKVTSTKRRDRVSAGDDTDDESSASEAEPRQSMGSALREKAADNWVSDDEGGPVRSTGVGLRFPSRPAPLAVPEDSDEDLPLSVTLHRAAQKLAIPRSHAEDDSDEDRPLSALLDKPKLNIPPIDFDNLPSPSSVAVKREDDDEDDVPLGVRASRFPNSSLFSGMSGMSQAGGNADDDDRPLAMHPEQLRKSQFMLAQAQAQQQQMLQAQLYQSMVFNPQPNLMMMAPSPMQFAAPAPMPIQTQDAAKFNRVDKWRQDVAIEQP